MLELMEYQKRAIEYFNKFGNRLLLSFQMGLGKTITSLNIVKVYNKRGLIVCPKFLKEQWRNEILKWNLCDSSEIYVSESVKDLSVCELSKYRYIILHYEELRFLEFFSEVYKVFKEHGIFNKEISREEFYLLLSKKGIYNNIKLSVMKHGLRKLELLSEDEEKLYYNICDLDTSEYVLIYDETYKVKNNLSKLYISYYILNKFKKFFGVIGLDGTIFYNNVLETANIVNLIKNSLISKNELKNFYYEINYGKYIKYKSRNLKQFNELLKDRIMYRVKRDDVSNDLVKIVYRKYSIKNSDVSKRLKYELLSMFDGIFMIYTILRTVDSYMNVNILSDSVGDDISDVSKYIISKYGGKEFINHEKLSCLYELLEEINDQVIVFTSFTRTCLFLEKELKKKGYNVVVAYGNNSNNHENVNKFLNKKSDILVTTDVLARGFNANHIDHLIHYDICPSNALMKQRDYRICRIDSTRQKFIHMLVSDVIEEDIYEIISRKQSNFNLVVDGMDNANDEVESVFRELNNIYYKNKVVGGK